MSDYPEPTANLFPELHAELDDLADRIETNIMHYLPVETDHGVTTIKFGSVSPEQYLRSMNADLEAMIPFYMKLTNITNRVFSRQTGIKSIGSLKDRKSSVLNSNKARVFAERVAAELDTDKVMQGVILAFRNAWQTDHRRHAIQLEENVLESLNDNGYEAYKGNTMVGEPDIVIDGAEAPDVTGEIRSISMEDMEKRKKNFDSEASIAKEEHPDAYFITVVELPKYALEEKGKGNIRTEICSYGNGNVDAVFFEDEMDELVVQLGKWGVTKKQTLPGVASSTAPGSSKTNQDGEIIGHSDSADTTVSVQQSLGSFSSESSDESLE